MARISSSFSKGNWKTRMMMTMSLGMRRKTTSRLRRTRWQGVSCVPRRLTKMMTEMTVGTPMMEPIVMMAPPVTTALEMMAATGAAATVMSAQVLRSSAVGS
jgi:hypothetical protein